MLVTWALQYWTVVYQPPEACENLIGGCSCYERKRWFTKEEKRDSRFKTRFWVGPGASESRASSGVPFCCQNIASQSNFPVQPNPRPTSGIYWSHQSIWPVSELCPQNARCIYGIRYKLTLIPDFEDIASKFKPLKRISPELSGKTQKDHMQVLTESLQSNSRSSIIIGLMWTESNLPLSIERTLCWLSSPHLWLEHFPSWRNFRYIQLSPIFSVMLMLIYRVFHSRKSSTLFPPLMRSQLRTMVFSS